MRRPTFSSLEVMCLGVMNWNTLLLMYGAFDFGLNNFDDETKLLMFGI
jgi:beta-galactosidase GanA